MVDDDAPGAQGSSPGPGGVGPGSGRDATVALRWSPGVFPRAWAEACWACVLSSLEAWKDGATPCAPCMPNARLPRRPAPPCAAATHEKPSV